MIGRGRGLRTGFGAAQASWEEPPEERYPACVRCEHESDAGHEIAGRWHCEDCAELVCAHCGDEEPSQERDGKRVCIECCREIDWEAEDAGTEDASEEAHT